VSVPVSVVMAVYNGSRYLAQQIESILEQLTPEDELLIVDDASRDDSVAVARAFDAPQIRIVANSTNSGVLKTFELGLRLARHDIIFLSDQDDIWLPGRREAFVEAFARDPRALIVISDVKVVDSNLQLVAESFQATRGGFKGGLVDTIWKNRYLGCAMALRRELLQHALPIPATVPMHDMWLGAICQAIGRAVYLPRAYLLYRRHGKNASPSVHQSLPVMLRWRMALTVAFLRRYVAIKLGRTGKPPMPADAPGVTDHD
jgi:glycosyltransferase involved in cell wall biosynthesis